MRLEAELDGGLGLRPGPARDFSPSMLMELSVTPKSSLPNVSADTFFLATNC